MQKISRLPIAKLTLIAVILLFSAQICKSQAVLLPYSYQYDQKFNSSIYSLENSFHTSLKPFLIDSVIGPRYNQLMQVGVDSNRKTWVDRKLLNEHLFDVQNKEFTFYGDYLPDLVLGRDFAGKTKTTLNTRGYQFGGTIGSKFFFYTSGYTNSGTFPNYLNSYIDKIDFVPGQAFNFNAGKANKDWTYVTAILSYTPIKQLNITLGQDKTFVGDGYRSLLLSDFAANYPLLRLTANLGKVQYMFMWAYMEDQEAKQFDVFGSNRRKWAAFHYLDWNVTNRLSLGYFNAIITSEADDNGNFHSFDPNFVNPVFFSNALNSTPSQPDNVLAGFTGKYKIFDKTALYGQLLIQRFNAGDFFSGNKADNTGGMQLGIRGADLFTVKSFNYLFEYNTVKPYTYASQQPITSYTELSEPLGDPLGANFKEAIGILNYTVGRFDFMGQLNYARYGLDPNALTIFGQDVTKEAPPTQTPATLGQGLSTTLRYAQGSVSFLINPKYNLRFELGGVLREEKNSQSDVKTALITFGLRSTFRDLYSDF